MPTETITTLLEGVADEGLRARIVVVLDEFATKIDTINVEFADAKARLADITAERDALGEQIATAERRYGAVAKRCDQLSDLLEAAERKIARYEEAEQPAGEATYRYRHPNPLRYGMRTIQPGEVITLNLAQVHPIRRGRFVHPAQPKSDKKADLRAYLVETLKAATEDDLKALTVAELKARIEAAFRP